MLKAAEAGGALHGIVFFRKDTKAWEREMQDEEEIRREEANSSAVVGKRLNKSYIIKGPFLKIMRDQHLLFTLWKTPMPCSALCQSIGSGMVLQGKDTQCFHKGRHASCRRIV
eukprot:1158487-Pelagomonas_calceolata.AAC.13